MQSGTAILGHQGSFMQHAPFQDAEPRTARRQSQQMIGHVEHTPREAAGKWTCPECGYDDNGPRAKRCGDCGADRPSADSP